MLPWSLTDSEAKNIYNALCKWYNSPENLPNRVGDTGVFFGYANFTRDKLWYCIEYLKKNYGKGWFTDNSTKRRSALLSIASELYDIFDKQVDANGIFKFLNWVYAFAAKNESAVKYFGGGNYTILDNIVNTAQQTIVEPMKQASENVAYAVSVPTLTSLLPNKSTVIKWGLIIGGGLIAYNMFFKKKKVNT